MFLARFPVRLRARAGQSLDWSAAEPAAEPAYALTAASLAAAAEPDAVAAGSPPPPSPPPLCHRSSESAALAAAALAATDEPSGIALSPPLPSVARHPRNCRPRRWCAKAAGLPAAAFVAVMAWARKAHATDGSRVRRCGVFALCVRCAVSLHGVESVYRP